MSDDGPRLSVNLRMTDRERERIDHAAAVAGQTRTAFMLAAALAKADETILDRVNLAWPEAALRAFRATLAEPPAPAPRALDAARKAGSKTLRTSAGVRRLRPTAWTSGRQAALRLPISPARQAETRPRPWLTSPQ